VRIELALPGEDLVVNHEPTLHGALNNPRLKARDSTVD
jgi:hypothetical protein